MLLGSAGITVIITHNDSLDHLSLYVQLAEVMGQMEHLLNVYAAKATPHSVAPFLGYIEVTAAQATKSLTEGLWLVSCMPCSRCSTERNVLAWFSCQLPHDMSNDT